MSATLIFTLYKASNKFRVVKGECDVAHLNEAYAPEWDSSVLNSSGELENAELFLLPTQFDQGTDELKITI